MIRPDHDRVLCASASRSGWSRAMRRADPCGALPSGLRLARTRDDIMDSGTCEKCGIACPLSDGGEDLQWLQKPARQMRYPDGGEQSIAKIPGGQYPCYRCVATKNEEHQRPRGKMPGDFLACGSRRVQLTPIRAVCQAWDSTLGGALAKMAMAQFELWKSTHRGELQLKGPQVKGFDMQELAAKIETLDAGDDESKGRIKSTLKKLAESGEARALPVPQPDWSGLLHVLPF